MISVIGKALLLYMILVFWKCCLDNFPFSFFLSNLGLLRIARISVLLKTLPNASILLVLQNTDVVVLCKIGTRQIIYILYYISGSSSKRFTPCE